MWRTSQTIGNTRCFMTRSASRVVVLFVLLTALPAAQQKPVRRCGVDRWPVKTWADKDAARVDPKPVNTAIRELGEIPIHEVQ